LVIRAYTIALVTFLALDSLWLGWIASGFYREQIGFMLRDEVYLPAAAVFYLTFVAALTHFAILPAIRTKNVKSSWLNGAFFGFATYAAYDLTNLAVTKDWPLAVTIVDLAWGTSLGAVVSGITTRIAR